MTTPEIIPAWIVDASPFIGLAKVGLLDLLLAPSHEILVSDVVEREVMAGSVFDLPQAALSQGWGVRVLAPPSPPALAAFQLDAGEASVLAVALNRPGSLVIIDDGPGRAAAKALGVPAVGTVGVLLRAKQDGRLDAISPVLHRLKAEGLFLPKESLLIQLAASVGEQWP